MSSCKPFKIALNAFSIISNDCLFSTRQTLDSTNELCYLIESEVRVPRLETHLELLYFYYLKYPEDENEKSFKYLSEDELLNSNQIRCFMNVNKSSDSYEQMDGAILFGVDTSLKEKFMRQSLTILLRLDYFFSSSIIDLNVQTNCLRMIRNIYACLCNRDVEYRSLFQKVK